MHVSHKKTGASFEAPVFHSNGEDQLEGALVIAVLTSDGAHGEAAQVPATPTEPPALEPLNVDFPFTDAEATW